MCDSNTDMINALLDDANNGSTTTNPTVEDRYEHPGKVK